MSDMFEPKKRSEIMFRVHSENTTPERRVRKILYESGFRYRLHRDDLPGKPDIVLSKYKTLIFVHGCFWHGCPTCRHAKIRPATNVDYWERKLDRTLARDRENQRLLKEMGWKVIVVWECETKKKALPILRERLLVEIKIPR
jgi:DNA mismatch endonuclease (patch repair protein)